MTMRVLFVDDSVDYRDRMAAQIEEVGDLEVIGRVSSGRDALEWLRRRPRMVQVVLLDIMMEGGEDGVEVATTIRGEWPDLIVILLSAYSDRHMVERASAAGVHGYLTKEVSAPFLVEQIERAAGGTVVLGDRPVRTMMQSLAARIDVNSPGARTFTMRYNALPERLNPVVDGLEKGLSDRQISEESGLSMGSVRTYVSQVLQSTGCKSRAEFLIKAARMVRDL